MLARRLQRALLVGLVVLLHGAASARAQVASAPARPITIGAGNSATVTVDPSGTAHIAFDGNEPTENSLHYCRLPRGATSCTVQTTITTTQTSLLHPFVVVNGNTIQVVSYRYGFSTGSFGQDVVFTSRNGGVTFDGGVAAGVNPFSVAILGPGGAASTVTHAQTAGMSYQRVPLDGSTVGGQQAILSVDHPYGGAVGLLDANTPIAVMADGNDNVIFRRYTGAGDPNDAANWTPAAAVGSVRTPHFAFGSSGVFLVGGAPSRELASRRWTGNAFGTSVTIPGGPGETPQAFATEDGGGRLHALLPQITADGSRLLYATSDDGTTWAARQFAFEPLAGQTQVSAAPDHQGFAVWESASGSGRQVFALPIGPSAATPTLAKSAAAALVSGTVRVKTPGSKSFTRLLGETVIPVGSIVDTLHGRTEITTALPSAATQSADFYSGVFKLTQAKSGLTSLTLQGGSFRSCKRTPRSARAAKKKRVIRHLWGKGKGTFRTKGRYGAAAVVGTTWDVADRCDGTLVTVREGSVKVRDFKRRKTVVVTKRRSYLAKA